MSLNNLPSHLDGLGRGEGAKRPCEEALVLCRQLAKESPVASINIFSVHLANLGRK